MLTLFQPLLRFYHAFYYLLDLADAFTSVGIPFSSLSSLQIYFFNWISLGNFHLSLRSCPLDFGRCPTFYIFCFHSIILYLKYEICAIVLQLWSNYSFSPLSDMLFESKSIYFIACYIYSS